MSALVRTGHPEAAHRCLLYRQSGQIRRGDKSAASGRQVHRKGNVEGSTVSHLSGRQGAHAHASSYSCCTCRSVVPVVTTHINPSPTMASGNLSPAAICVVIDGTTKAEREESAMTES